jgi:N-acetyl-gamma-glutamyl-phosphate reductase
MKVGVAGASGYAGIELMRLLSAHPDLDVVVAGANSHAGERVAAHTPSLAGAYRDLVYAETSVEACSGLDLVFLALPHGVSQGLVAKLDGEVGAVVDLAGDFRLKDPLAYPHWYGEVHMEPSYLERFVYGIPELFRSDLLGATLIASAGCYPTAASLALAPFVRAGAVERSGIVVDAASGVSGAGRSSREDLQFAFVNEDFRAYGLLNHRHTPEIEQAVGAEVIFTPHLVPMTRGILATCYARPVVADATFNTRSAVELLRSAYADEPFIEVVDDPPSTKSVYGSNCARLSARVDERTGWLIVLCAIDNLVKGAAGQAVQCANLALGLPETSGLPTTGVFP